MFAALIHTIAALVGLTVSEGAVTERMCAIHRQGVGLEQGLSHLICGPAASPMIGLSPGSGGELAQRASSSRLKSNVANSKSIAVRGSRP